MEAAPFASSSSSASSLSSRAVTAGSLSPTSSLLFRRNNIRNSICKFKSPRNLSVRASGDSGTLSLSLTHITFMLSDNLFIYYLFFSFFFSVVTLLDYGAGNVRSVRNAIRHLGFDITDVSYFLIFLKFRNIPVIQ
jgi:glutamine amidotransferase/cyclase